MRETHQINHSQSPVLLSQKHIWLQKRISKNAAIFLRLPGKGKAALLSGNQRTCIPLLQKLYILRNIMCPQNNPNPIFFQYIYLTMFIYLPINT